MTFGVDWDDIDTIAGILSHFGITLEEGEFTQRDGSTSRWFLRITDPDALMLKASNAYYGAHRKP